MMMMMMMMILLLHCFAHTWSSMEEEMVAYCVCCSSIFASIFWIHSFAESRKWRYYCTWMQPSPGPGQNVSQEITRQMTIRIHMSSPWMPFKGQPFKSLGKLNVQKDVGFWCCIQSGSQIGWYATCRFAIKSLKIRCPGSSFHKEKKSVSSAPQTTDLVGLPKGRRQQLRRWFHFFKEKSLTSSLDAKLSFTFQMAEHPARQDDLAHST